MIWCHAIIALCTETKDIIQEYVEDKSIENKIYIIPHPQYKVNIPIEKKSNQDEFLVTFAGQIRKYKNVELIIKLAQEFKNENVTFLIEGKEESKEYRKNLEESTQNINNIKFIFKYLSEDELCESIIKSDMIIMPYDKNSSLNSGMLFLAFSLKTTCLCPDIGSARDIHDQACFYMYTYSDETDHYAQMHNKFLVALDDFKKGKIREKNNQCKKEVEKYNSFEIVKRGYVELLENLV